jgi:hypothetical protein
MFAPMSVALTGRDVDDSPALPAAMHEQRLATHADLLAAWLERPDRPQRWRSEPFSRTVDLVRTHPRPIATREMLALSYAREHFHLISVGEPPAPSELLSRDATEVAYAIRWLELGDWPGSGSWASLV